MASRCFRDKQIWAAPPCPSSSASNRHASRNFNACLEIVSRCFVSKNHRRAAHNCRRSFGEVHEGSKCPRHIGITSAMLSNARVSNGDVYSM